MFRFRFVFRNGKAKRTNKQIRNENEKKKKFLGVVKTNLLKNLTNNRIVLLGGINFKTLRRSKMCLPSGIAAISWIKKNGPSINTGPF